MAKSFNSYFLLGSYIFVGSLSASNLFLDHYQPLKRGLFFIIIPVFLVILSHRQFKKTGKISNKKDFNKDFKFKIHYIDILLSGIYLFTIVGCIQAIDKEHAFEQLILYTLSLGLYGSFRFSRITTANLKIIYLALLFGCLGNLCYGILQILGYRPFNLFNGEDSLPSAFFGNANFAAQYISIGLILSITLFFTIWQKHFADISLSKVSQERKGTFFSQHSLIFQSPKIIILLIFSALLLFYFSRLQSRASALALMAGLFVFFYPQIKQSTVKSKRSTVLVLLGLVFIALVALVIAKLERNGLSSISIRFIRYMNSLYLIADHFWGIGLSQFQEVYPLYFQSYRPDPEMKPTMMVVGPHSDLLRIFAESGWLAGLSTFTVGLMVLFSGKKKTNHNKLLNKVPVFYQFQISKAIVCAFLVNGTFDFPLEHPINLALFYPALGVYVSHLDKKINVSFKTTRIVNKAALLVFFLLSILGPLLGVRHLVIKHLNREAIASKSSGRPELSRTANLWLTRISPAEEMPRYELIQYYLLFNKPELALVQAQAAIEHHPNNWIFWMRLADCYQALHKFSLAKKSRKRSRSIMPLR